jgi:hypothetical protein
MIHMLLLRGSREESPAGTPQNRVTTTASGWSGSGVVGDEMTGSATSDITFTAMESGTFNVYGQLEGVFSSSVKRNGIMVYTTLDERLETAISVGYGDSIRIESYGEFGAGELLVWIV